MGAEPEKAAIFKEVLQDYLSRTASRDWSDKAGLLGIAVDGRNVSIDFYGQKFTITPDGIRDADGRQPHHAVCVVLCQYLLLSPDSMRTGGELFAYRNFPDAAPYVQGFRNTAELPIARFFSGKTEMLKQRCQSMGGRPFTEMSGSRFAYEIPALPRVPVFLLFDDEDDEFGAECHILFRQSAQDYLDMECIAMLGSILATWLTRQKG